MMTRTGPMLMSLNPGRSAIRMPRKPMTTAPQRRSPIISPRIGRDSRVMKSGAANAMVMASAKAIILSPVKKHQIIGMVSAARRICTFGNLV